MEYHYERKKTRGALLGCSMAEGGRIIGFATVSSRASVAVELRKGRGVLIQPLLQFPNETSF